MSAAKNKVELICANGKPLNLHDVGALAAKFQPKKWHEVKKTTIFRRAFAAGDQALANGKCPFEAFDNYMEMIDDTNRTSYNIDPFNPYACEID